MPAFVAPAAPRPGRPRHTTSFTSATGPVRPRTIPRKPTRAPRACVSGAPGNASDDSDAELESALRDMGSVRQLLALVRLRGANNPVSALAMLRRSGALDSRVPRVRIAALDSLSRLGAPSDARMLADVLRGDSDHSVRAAAAAALAMLRLGAQTGDDDTASVSPRAVATCALRAAATQDKHFIVRYAAVVALGNVADTGAVPLLAALADDAGAPVLEAAAAVEALGEALSTAAAETGDGPDERCVRVVVSRAGDRDELMRIAVARTLGRWRAAAGVEDALQRMVDDERRYGQSAMVSAVLRDVMEGRLPPL